MISAILGIAIVALPAGIIIAGYQEELAENKQKKRISYKGNNVFEKLTGIKGELWRIYLSFYL